MRRDQMVNVNKTPVIESKVQRRNFGVTDQLPSFVVFAAVSQ